MTTDWCATYSPTCGICRERRNGAREALRKARATMACDETWHGGPGFVCHVPNFRDESYDDPGYWTDPYCWHELWASALLDGFTVEELTEAGG